MAHLQDTGRLRNYSRFGTLPKNSYTAKDYLDLKKYLEDISPNNELLISLKKELQAFGSILNTTNILFFLKIYSKFDEREKTLIRLSISSDEDFKKDLSWIW